MNPITLNDIIRTANKTRNPAQNPQLTALLKQFLYETPAPTALQARDALVTAELLPASTRRWLGLRSHADKAQQVHPGPAPVVHAMQQALTLPVPGGHAARSRAQQHRLHLLILRQQRGGKKRTWSNDALIAYRAHLSSFAQAAVGLRGEHGAVAKALQKYLQLGGDAAPLSLVLAECAGRLGDVGEWRTAVKLWNSAAPHLENATHPDAATSRLRAVQKRLLDAWTQHALVMGDAPLRPLAKETSFLDQYSVPQETLAGSPWPKDIANVSPDALQFVENLRIAAQNYGHPPANRRLLLSGPPGFGKSFLAYSFGREAAAHNVPMIEIHCSDLLNKYHGGTIANISRLFAEMRDYSQKHQRPVLLFLDEVEQLLGARNDHDKENGGIATTLVHLLQESDHVLAVGATNCPQILDATVDKVFNYRIEKKACGWRELKTTLMQPINNNILTDRQAHVLAQLSMGLSQRDLVFARENAVKMRAKGSDWLGCLYHAIAEAQRKRSATTSVEVHPLQAGVQWVAKIADFKARARQLPEGDDLVETWKVGDLTLQWVVPVSKPSNLLRLTGPRVTIDRHDIVAYRGAPKTPLPSNLAEWVARCEPDGSLVVAMSLTFSPAPR